jgi:hypothetical protein
MVSHFTIRALESEFVVNLEDIRRVSSVRSASPDNFRMPDHRIVQFDLQGARKFGIPEKSATKKLQAYERDSVDRLRLRFTFCLHRNTCSVFSLEHRLKASKTE